MIPQSTAEVLEMAIEEEEKAAKAYRNLAAAAEKDEVRGMLIRFAEEEEAHRESLMNVRLGDLEVFAKPWPEKSELLFVPREGELAPDATPPTVILAAMDDERRAFLLYTALAERSEDPGVKTLLGAIAREEAHHWHSLEKIYDSMCHLGEEI